ncbi:MAG: C10 family peptidase [Prevotella sp.]|nr:C10 family peptidase [Prevotella sp.]
MKKLCIIIGILLGTIAASAESITKNQAVAIARQFFGENTNTHYSVSIHPIGKARRAPANHQPYYIINRGYSQGFAIVAGDDRLPPILGYSDKGSVNTENMPDALIELLDFYTDEIENICHIPITQPLHNSHAKKTVASIRPLLGKTAWDQGFPYNLLTPCYTGNVHSATGCAATAMSQIMYYHRYPESGRGQHAYQTRQNRMNLEVDFSKSHYQWDLMQPTYGDWDAQENRNAVALLMRDCGYAIDMDYGATSGAEPDAWPIAIINFFGYDRGLTNRHRENYSIDEWNHIIHTELSAGRPVFAGGFSTSGGHAFVIDGCDEMGLFHINWGWSGISNGYFRTSALTPAIQGTGGADGGFNARQTIITGIQPACENAALTPEFTSSEAVKVTVTNNQNLTLKLGGKVTNVGWCDATVDLGFGIYNTDWQLLLTVPSDKEETCEVGKGEFRIGISSSTTDISVLPDGDYTIYPIVSEHGKADWHRIHTANQSKPNYQKLTIADGHPTVNSPTRSQLTATAVQPLSKFYQNVKACVSLTLHNTGDLAYSGPISLALIDPESGAKVSEDNHYQVDVYAHDSLDLQMISTFSTAPGNYHLAIIDENGQKLNHPLNIQVDEAPEGEAEVEVTDTLECLSNTTNDLRFKAHLHAPAGVFASNIVVYIYDEYETTTTPLGALEPQFVFIEPNGTVDVTFSGTMENALIGTTYKATLVNLDNNDYIRPRRQASCLFNVGSNVNAIVPTFSTVSPNDKIYDLMGRQVTKPTKGVVVSEGRKWLWK